MEQNIIRKLEKDNWLEISSNFSNPNIKAIFSLKSLDQSSMNSRKSFADSIGFVHKDIIIPQQTHSNNVIFCQSSGRVSNCDGVFSDNSGYVCSIQVADCMPVFFAHRSKLVFGLVHAGWRGLVGGIFNKTVSTLLEKKLDLIEFEIIIGPSIQACCFEVREDVLDQFDSRFVTPKSDGHYQVNLQQLAFNELSDLGYDNKKIHIMPDCTYCLESQYYSFRRNGKKAGRMIGLIGVK